MGNGQMRRAVSGGSSESTSARKPLACRASATDQHGTRHFANGCGILDGTDAATEQTIETGSLALRLMVNGPPPEVSAEYDFHMMGMAAWFLRRWITRPHSASNTQSEEARHLAERLEAANERIIEAILDAEQARTDAEIASRAKSEFLTTISHEIRTPLNAIVGYAELLRMEIAGPLNEKQRAHLSRLDMSSRHLLRLVNEMLDLESVESGNLELTHAQAGAVATLQSACTIMAPDFRAKDIRLTCPEKDDGNSMFRGDPERVKQILVNLLSNAAKFTPSGGRVDVTVEVGLHAVGFVVVDTGPGVPAQKQDTIFEPFVQADSSFTRDHGGAGLGLAISRKLARMMGGDLTVRNQPGRGARFTLHVPVALPREAGAEEELA